MKSKVQVLEQIAELAEVEPEEVPRESRFLLEVDFSSLVLDRTERQEYWVAAMKVRSALVSTGALRHRRQDWVNEGRKRQKRS